MIFIYYNLLTLIISDKEKIRMTTWHRCRDEQMIAICSLQ